MELMARPGVHALTFPDNPTAWGLPSIHSPEWDALWKTCADYEVMICCHIGSGGGAPHASMDTPIEAWLLSMPIPIANSAADWMHSTRSEARRVGNECVGTCSSCWWTNH